MKSLKLKPKKSRSMRHSPLLKAGYIYKKMPELKSFACEFCQLRVGELDVSPSIMRYFCLQVIVAPVGNLAVQIAVFRYQGSAYHSLFRGLLCHTL